MNPCCVEEEMQWKINSWYQSEWSRAELEHEVETLLMKL